ncbi:hypothetical protein BC828DRAFT_275561 [Blastocladiella britannica]|nr:hypothetical protein BC828DRAFT_275561 [Blastocladiella britannica]
MSQLFQLTTASGPAYHANNRLASPAFMSRMHAIIDQEHTRAATLSQAKGPHRSVFSPLQIAILTRVLRQDNYPPTQARHALADALGMTRRQVQIWFQNQRQKRRNATRTTEPTASGDGNGDDDDDGNQPPLPPSPPMGDEDHDEESLIENVHSNGTGSLGTPFPSAVLPTPSQSPAAPNIRSHLLPIPRGFDRILNPVVLRAGDSDDGDDHNEHLDPIKLYSPPLQQQQLLSPTLSSGGDRVPSWRPFPPPIVVPKSPL